jgi:biopolymer transport protein TolR
MGEAVINIHLLEKKIREYFAGKAKKIVFIQSDKDISYGFFVDVIDIIRKAEVETIALVTEPKELETAKTKK